MSNANRKPLILIIIAVLTFTFAVVGASFAYFIAQKGTGSSANAVVKTKTTDALTFQAGNPINIEVNQANFGSGAGNKSYETTATVNLRANTGNNTATYNYYVYLDIITNNFEYTSGTIPELIMTLTDQNGKEVKTLEGYNYVTSGGVSGFDVTRTNGLVKLVDNKVITTTSNIRETWKVKITFVNLSGDQQKNTGKTFSGAIKIQKEKLPTTFAEILIANNGIIGMDHHVSTLANGANDGSYRYSGNNPKNYICFGSDDIVCPEENQYRIIGVFENHVKIIQKLNILSGRWNGNDVNTWAGSTIERYLNIEYLNNFLVTWQNKIATVTWQVGGMTDAHGIYAVPSTAYSYEVGPNTANVTFNGKIGLMYVSDYGFATSPSGWNITIGNFDNPAITNNNWLYSNKYEWTISPNPEYSRNAFFIQPKGTVTSNDNYNFVSSTNSIRPAFYLESSIKLVGGKGTEQNPYRI